MKRVPMAKQGERSIVVEDGATAGATFGVDLRWPDGRTVQVSDFEVAPPSDDALVTYWRFIREIPASVVALADTSTTGLYVITGAGTSATRTIESDTLDVVNAGGVAGNPKIDLPPLRLPAGETIHGRRIVRAEDGEAFHPLLSDPLHALGCVGLALNSAAESDIVSIRQRGQVTDSGWSWSAGLVYCDDEGVLTQSAPPTGWFLIVGRAVAADTIDIDLQLPVIRSS